MYKYLIVICVIYCVTAKDIYTENTLDYHYILVNTSSVHFKVKAANDAHIALTTATADPMIEIVIGGWGNTNSVIRRLKRTLIHKVTAETPGILSGYEHRGFWISWDSGFIKVGREGTDTPFMSWADTNPFPIKRVGVHTGYGATGSWIIEEFPFALTTTTPFPSSAPDDIIVSCRGYIHTKDKLAYKFFPVSNSGIHFKVVAANDVHVALTTGPHETEPIVEIVIGGWGNTNSVIRRLYRTLIDKVTAETPDILSGSELRGFWVSWDGGVVKVGREGADTPFMSWADPNPFPVAYVGVHTGYGATGSWILQEPPSAPVSAPALSATTDSVPFCRGPSCPTREPLSPLVPRVTYKDLITPGDFGYHFFPATSGTVHFKVKARLCACINLTTIPQRSSPMIDVCLGTWDNTRSLIGRNRHDNFKEFDTPGVLNGDEYRGFWIRWDAVKISVGLEGTDAPFMSWEDQLPIAYVGVCTCWNATGSWIIEVPKAAPVAPSLF